MGPPAKPAWLKRNTGSSRLTGSGCSGPRNRLSLTASPLWRGFVSSLQCAYSDAVPFRATLSPAAVWRDRPRRWPLQRFWLLTRLPLHWAGSPPSPTPQGGEGWMLSLLTWLQYARGSSSVTPLTTTSTPTPLHLCSGINQLKSREVRDPPRFCKSRGWSRS